jgi:hypothetical protein
MRVHTIHERHSSLHIHAHKRRVRPSVVSQSHHAALASARRSAWLGPARSHHAHGDFERRALTHKQYGSRTADSDAEEAGACSSSGGRELQRGTCQTNHAHCCTCSGKGRQGQGQTRKEKERWYAPHVARGRPSEECARSDLPRALARPSSGHSPRTCSNRTCRWRR